MLQTNGLLLDRLPAEVLHRFHTLLVSIDGPEALTDRHRGEGVYARVLANVERLVADGFPGELIARMTVDEATGIEEAVLHCDGLPVSGVHWQLDANFWGDHAARDFARWVRESYDPGIRRLVDAWVARMEAGEVARWYPFLDTTWDLLRGEPSRLRCGSGYANYTIQTDGTIVPCPIMTGMTGFYLGHIRDADPLAIPEVPVGGCGGCDLAVLLRRPLPLRRGHRALARQSAGPRSAARSGTSTTPSSAPCRGSARSSRTARSRPRTSTTSSSTAARSSPDGPVQ